MPGAEQPKGIQLQPRDFELLRDLFESRVMRLDHIATLHFDGHREAAKKRVARLKRAGFLRERPRRSNEAALHFLGRRAIELLHQHGHLANYPHLTEAQLERRLRVSDLTLRHELEVMDVKAALTAAVNRTKRFSIAECSSWPKLHEFTSRSRDGRKILVRPDGFLRIHEQCLNGGFAKHLFFLELDRSTESLGIVVGRCHCYLDYYRSGGFAVRNGVTRELRKRFPFRLLVVSKSRERQQNILMQLSQHDRRQTSQVWFTTVADLISNPLGKIWTFTSEFARHTSLLPWS